MPRRSVLIGAAAVVLAGAVAVAYALMSSGGLSSQPVGRVPELLSEPAGIPGAGLTLEPDGLAAVAFGDREADVIAKLNELLGDPVEDATEPCGSSGGTVRWVRWANLTVALQAGAFTGYISGIYFPPDSPEMPIRTADGVGLRATTAELSAAYGDRLAWLGQQDGFGNPVDAFGIDGFDVNHLAPTGLGGYVEGGRDSGRVITLIGGQPCVDNGP